MERKNGKIIGRIMPQQPDSRQQPKSLAHRLIEERVKNERYHKLVPPPRPPMRRHDCTFIRFGRDGAAVLDRHSGQQLGTIMQTVSEEVLRSSPGIQSWSKPEPVAEVVNLDGTPHRKLTRAEEDARKGRMLPHVNR